MNKESNKLALEYLKTTDLHPTGVYKLQPLQTVYACIEWLKENKYVKNDKKESK